MIYLLQILGMIICLRELKFKTKAKWFAIISILPNFLAMYILDKTNSYITFLYWSLSIIYLIILFYCIFKSKD